MSISDVADQLDVSTKTVRRYIAEGRLPAYRLAGRAVRIRQADVEALLVRIPSARV